MRVHVCAANHYQEPHGIWRHAVLHMEVVGVDLGWHVNLGGHFLFKKLGQATICHDPRLSQDRYYPILPQCIILKSR